MSGKQMVLTLYNQKHLRPNWRVDLAGPRFELFFADLAGELARLGIKLELLRSSEVTIEVDSYADLLNAVRVSSPADGFTNKCVGHIIGKSPNLDLYEDIRRAVSRLAFAPETVAPEDEHRRVCHNCGCGC